MAVLKGRFKWVTGHGWIWLDSIRPQQTWERCPWCWGTLADLDDALVKKVQGWLANGWPNDTDEGEES